MLGISSKQVSGINVAFLIFNKKFHDFFLPTISRLHHRNYFHHFLFFSPEIGKPSVVHPNQKLPEDPSSSFSRGNPSTPPIVVVLQCVMSKFVALYNLSSVSSCSPIDGTVGLCDSLVYAQSTASHAYGWRNLQCLILQLSTNQNH